MSNTIFNKSIIRYFSNDNPDLPNYYVHKKDVEIEFKFDDFSIYFVFTYSKIGLVIKANSSCLYKINIIDNFYSKSNYKRNYEYQYGYYTYELTQILFQKQMYNGIDRHYFNINDNFEERIKEYCELEKKYIIKILNVLESELKNNLKNLFNSKDKKGIFEFSDSDMLILYHLYKPNELPKYLVELQKKYIPMVSSIIDNMNILISEICHLNNLDYELYKIKSSIFLKLLSKFKS